MDLEQDYIEYVVEFSVALFAVSASYFISLDNPITLSVLILVPILFGYTAYISRNEFKWSSLFGFISMIFIPLNAVMAAVAIIIAVGNTLTSFFAGGTDFKDYYRATMLPLLFTGLVLGGTTYMAATFQPDFGDNLRTNIAEIAGNQTSEILDETNLIEMQQNANTQVIEQVSTGTVTATQGYVINRTQDNLSAQDQQAVMNAFNSAQSKVPQQMLKATEEAQQGNKILNISDRVSRSVENLLAGKNILILVPVITFGMYGLQPVVGLLTAIFAKLIERIGRANQDEF